MNIFLVNKVNHIGDYGSEEEVDNVQWNLIKISHVDDKIIKKLITHMKSELSDNFFISFESLINIGMKARELVSKTYNEYSDSTNFRKYLFQFILNFYDDIVECPLVLRLYHPDFIIRAKNLMQIEEKGDISYLKFIIPLMNDPDDSVRWATIRVLESFKQFEDNPIMVKKIQHRINKEPNPVIKEKLEKIFSQN